MSRVFEFNFRRIYVLYLFLPHKISLYAPLRAVGSLYTKAFLLAVLCLPALNVFINEQKDLIRSHLTTRFILLSVMNREWLV